MDRTGIGLLLVCLLCVSPCVLGQDMVNVAANATGRTCRQSSFLINRYGACNAANGNTGGTYSVTGANANCIFTAVTAYYSNENGQNVEDRTPWWQVDLGGMYPVQDITVWGRDVETHSLYPFNITVDGQQCARAVSGGRNISVTCDKVIYGQKVLLTRDHKAGPDYSLNMCELEVWVCQSGYHRVSNKICELCNTNCDRGCDRNNGRCDSCKSGYHGDQCDSQCSTIHYRCTQCTQDSTCTACSNNSQAPACTACAPNTYGENCSERCGRCKGEQPCKASTGECTGECQPGYTGTLCKTECGAGLYGAECNQTCGGCQVNTTCHHEDGHCLVGCVAEFAGLLCLQATSQENKDDGATNWVGPIVGAIVGVGLVMTISVTAAICRRRKSDSSRSGGQDRPTASPTMQDSAPTVSPEPSPLRQASSNEDHIYIDILDPDDIYDVENSGSTDGDTATEISGQRPPSSSSTHNSMAYYEIPDTTNTLEMSEVQDNYDILHPYSNDDAERQPYSQLTSHASDVTQTSGDTAHANNA